MLTPFITKQGTQSKTTALLECWQEEGKDLPVIVRPADLSFKEARVVGQVSLQNIDSPEGIIFYLDFPNLPRTCAVIAEVQPGEQGIEDGTVAAVIVQRDIRLE